MTKTFLYRVFTFVVLVLLQSFIFSRLSLGTYIQPCIYILFILFLPFGYSRLLALLWAFALGFSIDLLSTDIIGINTAATVALAFFRPYLLRPFSAKSDFDAIASPSSKIMGWPPFIGYVTLAVLFHQSLLFLLDSFGFQHFLHTVIRIALSTLCSTVLIILIQTIFTNNKTTVS